MTKYLRLTGFYFRNEGLSLAVWFGALAFYNIINVYLFKIYGDKTSIAEVYRMLPVMWRNMFGRYFISVNSVEGWLTTQFFSFLPLIVGVYLGVLSASLFAKEFENRSIESILVQPVSRWSVYLSKVTVVFICLVAILAGNVAVTFATSSIAGIRNVIDERILLPYAASAMLVLFLAMLAVLIAVLVDDQKVSSAAFLGIMVFLFLGNAVLITLKALPGVQRLNPFYYFDCTKIVRSLAIPRGGMLYWLGGATVLAACAGLRFRGKDIV